MAATCRLLWTVSDVQKCSLMLLVIRQNLVTLMFWPGFLKCQSRSTQFWGEFSYVGWCLLVMLARFVNDEKLMDKARQGFHMTGKW